MLPISIHAPGLRCSTVSFSEACRRSWVLNMKVCSWLGKHICLARDSVPTFMISPLDTMRKSPEASREVCPAVQDFFCVNSWIFQKWEQPYASLWGSIRDSCSFCQGKAFVLQRVLRVFLSFAMCMVMCFVFLGKILWSFSCKGVGLGIGTQGTSACCRCRSEVDIWYWRNVWR